MNFDAETSLQCKVAFESIVPLLFFLKGEGGEAT